MICPTCNTSLDKNLTCPQCGWDWSRVQWVLLGRFSPPNHLIIASLLQSHNIPLKTINQEVAQFPFNVGPLSEVLFFVPDHCLEDALELINPPSDSA